MLRPIAAGTLTQVVLVLEMEPHGWHGALDAVGLGYPKHRAAEEDLSALKAFVEDVMDDAMNAKDEVAAAWLRRFRGCAVMARAPIVPHSADKVAMALPSCSKSASSSLLC